MHLLSSLTNRIFLATALLTVLAIGAATFVVNRAVVDQAEEELRRGVEEAAALVQQHRNLLFEHFALEARLVADLPKLKAAVETGHAPTVGPVAADYRRRIGADAFIVTDTQGQRLVALGDSGIDDPGWVDPPGVSPGQAAAWFRPGQTGLLQMVTVPIWIDTVRPELLGTLTVGYRLDAGVAEQFKQLTDSEIAFAFDGRVHASTLLPAVHGTLERLLSDDDVGAVRLGEEEYFAVARPLAVPPDADPGAVALPGGPAMVGTGAPTALVLRSRTARLRFLQPLRTALLITAVVALLLAPVLSYVVARTITRPLGIVIGAMREIAVTGDLTRHVSVPSEGVWQDEDTRLLAGTLNTLADSVLHSQREAAQRERFSSLGRMSTVIAHEIRNPLLIIKAALRTLRRDTGSEPALAAASDIGEEVDRLNQLVGEVLDFARPTVFSIAPARLNALCRDAAQAVTDSEPGPPIVLALDDGADAVETDIDRLRIVVVNLLTNARQAVQARHRAGAVSGPTAGSGTRPPTAAGGPPDIQLRTHAVDGERVAVVVRDRGVGIAADDLPKVFDPYFTTKRDGSGLGLAIAKNIVDGLGGVITARGSADGTVIQVELPRRGPSSGHGAEAGRGREA